jgi:hypothetical protein
VVQRRKGIDQSLKLASLEEVMLGLRDENLRTHFGNFVAPHASSANEQYFPSLSFVNRRARVRANVTFLALALRELFPAKSPTDCD